MGLNPAHIVPVTDFSPDTLLNIIANLEVSIDFEHLVYRESELDAIWSITGFMLTSEPDAKEHAATARLHQIAHVAHDLVADHRPEEAAAVLRGFL